VTQPEIAVVGAGLIGQRHVREAIAQAKLCAIIDPSSEATETARRVGVPHFQDLVGYLANNRPDGAIIATPNTLHADHAVSCLEAGVPVLIEKPIAESAAAAARIVETAERTGVPVLVGHHRRHNPIIKRAKAAIDAGELGEIVTVQGQFWLYKPDDYFQAAWRKGPGAGPTLINLIHDIDLMRYLCGEIADIHAMRSAAQRGQQVEDTAAITLRFANGALGAFTVSDTVAAPWSWEMTSAENPIYPHRPGACYMIGGTHGSLSIPDLKFWQHKDTRSWCDPIDADTLEVQPADAFALQFTHFVDVIKGDKPLVSAREGAASLRAVLLVLDSPLIGKEAL